ncbi:MAG: hypothetical protein K1X55_03470 [Chitinophagales bacterium]|nr:hypothetical protein [Chitinophagales bacterium]
MSILERKVQIIDRIIHLNDHQVLDNLELLLDKSTFKSVIKPISERLDVEKMKQLQRYTTFNQNEFNRLVSELGAFELDTEGLLEE